MRLKPEMVVVSLATALLVARVPGCRPAAKAERPFVAAMVSLGRQSLPYAIYLPPGYSPKKPWPVILCLHGFGERGSDGVAPTRAALGAVLQRHPERFRCLVILPQTNSLRWSGMANRLALASLE